MKLIKNFSIVLLLLAPLSSQSFEIDTNTNSSYRRLQSSRSSINFGPYYNYLPVYDTRTVTIRNVGNVDAENIRIFNSTGAEFSVTDNCYSGLRPGDSCSINIRFRTNRPGHFWGRINISARDADGYSYPSETISLNATVRER